MREEHGFLNWRKVVRSDGYLFWSGTIPCAAMITFVVYMFHYVEEHMAEIVERAHGDPPRAVTAAGIFAALFNLAFLAMNLTFRHMNKEIDALNRKRAKELDERTMRLADEGGYDR